MPNDIGVVGLGVMGQNLALNMARNGFTVAGIDLDPRKAEQMRARTEGMEITVADGWRPFIDALRRPRRILMMVPAGKAVDAVLDEVTPLLDAGDILIDGGNSHFLETIRRGRTLAAKGLHYIGSGVSGGEEGALHGPCLMPGGPREAYDLIEPVLSRIAAKVDGEPCCTYVGGGGAGHFVKTVHNGIEYGVMQLICETYDLLHRGLGLPTPAIREIMASWNQGELGSFLLEITVLVLGKVDPETGRPLVELILDHAEQKGTGKWTAQSALDLGVPVPTLAAAVEARILSGLKTERVKASSILPGPAQTGADSVPVETVQRAFHLGVLACYAQGFALLREADGEYGFGLDCGEIARIWRGGCIIRARLLDRIRLALRRDPALTNLLLSPEFAPVVRDGQEALRRAAIGAASRGIPAICLSATLAYYDSYRTERLPANILQAQRDHFGAHTYRRLDREGVFHTDWTK
ncbi:MAG: NADP-dependent phosphogluconate dehydrogenase [Bacteroidota bacterium]